MNSVPLCMNRETLLPVCNTGSKWKTNVQVEHWIFMNDEALWKKLRTHQKDQGSNQERAYHIFYFFYERIKSTYFQWFFFVEVMSSTEKISNSFVFDATFYSLDILHCKYTEKVRKIWIYLYKTKNIARTSTDYLSDIQIIWFIIFIKLSDFNLKKIFILFVPS